MGIRLEIDSRSSEAIYMQLTNQIILEIAMARLREGDALPSVRVMAEQIGINMHTVNKAYAVLRECGFVIADKRRGTIIAIQPDKERAWLEAEQRLRVLIAKGYCNKISRAEMHMLVDKIYDEYER